MNKFSYEKEIEVTDIILVMFGGLILSMLPILLLAMLLGKLDELNCMTNAFSNTSYLIFVWGALWMLLMVLAKESWGNKK